MQTEQELIQQAMNCNEAAWCSLMQDHQEAVFRLAYLILRDSDAAEDIAQETFIRAFRKLHLHDQQRALRPWLLQITNRLARNYQRSMRRYIAALKRWWQESNKTTEPERWTERQWQAQELHQAIARLRPIDQEILYARFFLDLNEAELAHFLEIPKGTVKSRLHRASARLRTIIEQDYPSLIIEDQHEHT